MAQAEDEAQAVINQLSEQPRGGVRIWLARGGASIQVDAPGPPEEAASQALHTLDELIKALRAKGLPLSYEAGPDTAPRRR